MKNVNTHEFIHIYIVKSRYMCIKIWINMSELAIFFIFCNLQRLEVVL